MISQQTKKPLDKMPLHPIYGDNTISHPSNASYSHWKYGAAIAIFCIIVTVNVLMASNRHESNRENNEEDYYKLQPSKRDLFTNSTCKKRIVGYYTGFETVSITKQQISKLTHAVFAYVKMTDRGTLRFKDEVAEQRFLSMKNKAKSMKSNVKVMISIGGEENSKNFSPVTEDSKKRKLFITSIYDFLKGHKINGVDIYWKDLSVKNTWDYITFIKELREKFTEAHETAEPYIISLTLPAAGIANWEMAYDLEEFMDNIDFINVFSMDYYGPWDNEYGVPAGPIAPLYSGVGNRKNFNVDYTMQYYVCKVRNPNKFNIVIPFFGRFWNGVKDAIEPGKEAFRNAELKDGKGDGYPYMSRWTMKDKGFNTTNSIWDEESKSSYIYDSDKRTYLTFETKESIDAKTKYVNDKNLGGVWIWSVDMDDDKSTLLSMVSSKELCSIGSGNTVKYHC